MQKYYTYRLYKLLISTLFEGYLGVNAQFHKLLICCIAPILQNSNSYPDIPLSFSFT